MREVLRVDGVSKETKIALQALALKRYGHPNASMIVREMIAKELASPKPTPAFDSVNNAETGRVTIRIGKHILEHIDGVAESRFSTRNYFIYCAIMEYIGHHLLHGDEIESLRTSNYELKKIGQNINQITKAINILVQLRGDGKMPEIGKKLASLSKEIKAHVSIVLKVLDKGTSEFNQPKRGRLKSSAKNNLPIKKQK